MHQVSGDARASVVHHERSLRQTRSKTAFLRVVTVKDVAVAKEISPGENLTAKQSREMDLSSSLELHSRTELSTYSGKASRAVEQSHVTGPETTYSLRTIWSECRLCESLALTLPYSSVYRIPEQVTGDMVYPISKFHALRAMQSSFKLSDIGSMNSGVLHEVAGRYRVAKQKDGWQTAVMLASCFPMMSIAPLKFI